MSARRTPRLIWGFGLVVLAAAILAACGGSATTAGPQPTAPVEAVSPTSAATESPSTSAAAATESPLPTPAPTEPLPTGIAPTAEPPAEQRVVELEWPSAMRLGESDIIRISLIPTKNGYTVTTEFPEHQVTTQEVPVPRPGGYDLAAVARLDGVGFDIGPAGDQMQGLPLDETVTWRWTITPRAAGQQRLSLSLKLRWTPSAGNTAPTLETTIYSKGLDVQVRSFFGLTSGQATAAGFVGIVVGGSLSLPLAASMFVRPRRRSLPALDPNPSLAIEKHPSFDLSAEETSLLRVLFRRYARLTLEAEFRSGYSGARTFLALPVRADGRADAYTIAKIGDRDSIQREFENYETHVKDTLPPITARIQEMPVTPTPPPVQRNGRGARGGGKAILRYTFIGEAGRTPTSLRESLISHPDPSLLDKLFETFGPNWWMQRRPYTFRLAQEYDRMLPAHYVLAPVDDARLLVVAPMDGRKEPAANQFEAGAVTLVQNMQVAERRADGKSLSLVGQVVPGHPPLRARWLGLSVPNYPAARVVATREMLLRELVKGFDLCGLPDPFMKLPALLNERVIGAQSTIHGDLNVENVLVGPGGFLWLIDFAQTRDGPPLYDFAHLEAEIIAHVIAPTLGAPSDILPLLGPPREASNPLISTLHSIASRCLFNPSQPREYQLALYVACLGALKFVNLNAHQKHVLYLAAAHIAQSL